MAKECSKCIHNAVCKTAESCDGYVSGCKHFKEEKNGRWIQASNKPGVQIGMKCSLCGARIKYSELHNGNHNYCHKCGADMKGE